MIDIVMRGMCEGCEYADLVLDAVSVSTTGGDIPVRKSWMIRCEHMMACLAMRKAQLKQMQMQIPEEDPKRKEKRYTADEFCDKLKDFINQEHEKQEAEE